MSQKRISIFDTRTANLNSLVSLEWAETTKTPKLHNLLTDDNDSECRKLALEQKCTGAPKNSPLPQIRQRLVGAPLLIGSLSRVVFAVAAAALKSPKNNLKTKKPPPHLGGRLVLFALVSHSHLFGLALQKRPLPSKRRIAKTRLLFAVVPVSVPLVVLLVQRPSGRFLPTTGNTAK